MSAVVWSPELHSAIKICKSQDMKEGLSDKLQSLGLLSQEKKAINELLHRPKISKSADQLDLWF